MYQKRTKGSVDTEWAKMRDIWMHRQTDHSNRNNIFPQNKLEGDINNHLFVDYYNTGMDRAFYIEITECIAFNYRTMTVYNWDSLR